MAERIDPGAAIGRVALTMRDGEAMAAFYERVLGLQPLGEHDRARLLGAGGRTLVELHPRPAAAPRPARTSGLFHLALLVPDRGELARSLRRLVVAGWPLDGASDHLVSEALYLTDPEGNGIEVYRDRPRSQWRRDGDEVAMATLPLAIDALLAEAPADPGRTVAPGTRIGHVHLDVDDLAATERFYAEALGLDVTARSYPGALFLAAGGYHHHLGANVWRRAVGPPPADALGLRWYELELPTAAARDAVGRALKRSGIDVEDQSGMLATRDPAGIRLLLSSASAP